MAKGPPGVAPKCPLHLRAPAAEAMTAEEGASGPGQAGQAAYLSGGEAEGQVQGEGGCLGTPLPWEQSRGRFEPHPFSQEGSDSPPRDGWVRIYQAGSDTQRETGMEPPQVTDLRLLEQG